MRVEPYVSGLSQYYYLYSKRVNQKSYQSIDDVAQTGKTRATGKVLSAPNIDSINITDFDTLVQLLSNPLLRLKILQHLGSHNLMKLIGKFLEKEKMILGLNFFSQQKLLDLLGTLPPDKLLKVLIKLFSAEGLIKLLPTKELMKMLWSHKINEQDIQKILSYLPTHVLVQLVEAVQGKAVGKTDQNSVLKMINGLRKEQLLDGINALPRAYVESIAKMFLQNEPTIVSEVSKESLFRAISHAEKPRLIQSMIGLNREDIGKFIGALPHDLMAKVATMINPENLAAELISQHSNILTALF